MIFLPVITVIALVICDQAAKHLAVLYLRPAGSIELVRGVFNLTFVSNQGAAFGMLQGSRWFFVIITVVVLIAEAYYYVRLPRGGPYSVIRAALLLIAAGALGNFIDRLANGSVVDMFEFAFIRFPVFNLADSYVVVGAGLLIFATLIFGKKLGARRGAEPGKKGAAPEAAAEREAGG